jgi:hypothetical protein
MENHIDGVMVSVVSSNTDHGTFECCPIRLIFNNWDNVLNAAVNNISVILEETGVPQKTTELLQFTDKHYHNVVHTVKVLLFIGTTFRGFYKMH